MTLGRLSAERWPYSSAVWPMRWIESRIGRTSGLRHHDGRLRGDRMAALPGLPPVEQLVDDEDRDQQYQQASDRVRGQRPGCPPAPLRGVGELAGDKRQRD